MLGMAFFKSLVKHHGKAFFEPIGRTLHELGAKQPNPLNPSHLWALKRPMFEYAKWYSQRRLLRSRWSSLPDLSQTLRGHATFAQRVLSRSGLEISATMRRHQLKLADRQCRMSAISTRLQDAVVILVTSLCAARQQDPTTKAAADAVCRELRHRITGSQPSDADFRQVTDLGTTIAREGWTELSELGTGLSNKGNWGDPSTVRGRLA